MSERGIKEKPKGAKGAGRKPRSIPKEFMRRQLVSGKERVKEQFRGAGPEQERPEDYGGERIESAAWESAILVEHGVNTALRAGTDRMPRRRPDEPIEREEAPWHEYGAETDAATGTAGPKRGDGEAPRIKTRESAALRGADPMQEAAPRRTVKGKSADTRQERGTAGEHRSARPADGHSFAAQPTMEIREAVGGTAIPERVRPKNGTQEALEPRTRGGMGDSGALGAATHKKPQIHSDASSVAGSGARIKRARPQIKTGEQAAQPVKAAEQAKAKAIHDARQAARSSREAMKGAYQSSRAAEKSTGSAARALRNMARAAAESLRGLLASLAAGSSPVLAIVLVICLVALLLATPFGIFFSGEPGATGETVQTAMVQLNGEFCLVIEQIQADNPHDVLELDNDGVAAMLANWRNVLSVYAVRVTTDEFSPDEVATMTPQKQEILRGVFWDMNRISYAIETVEDPETEESTTMLTISITVKNKDEIAAEYDFTAEQLELLDELAQPEYDDLFAMLIGSNDSLILSSAQIGKIMNNLPDDLSEERRQVILTAYKLIGKVNYFWGGCALFLDNLRRNTQ